MSRLKVALLGGACSALLVVGWAYGHASRRGRRRQPTAHPAFDQQSLWQTWRVYCYSCHAAPNASGGVNLLALDESNLGKDPVVWEKVLRKIRMREMPPAGAAQPDAATYDAIVSFIENERERSAELNPNPGRPALHRLNRTEYANAVRDLLALEIDATELLPADDIGYGFDNIGDVLTVSPLLLERYLSAASKVSRAAIGDTSMPRAVPDLQRAARAFPGRPDGRLDAIRLARRLLVPAPLPGRRRVRGLGEAANRPFRSDPRSRARPPARRADRRREAGPLSVAANARAGQIHGAEGGPDAHLEVRVPVKAGTRTVSATFLKDTVLPEGIVLPDREQAFFEGVGSISVAGPYNAAGPGRRPAASGSSSAVRHRRAKSGLARKRSSRRSPAARIAARSATTIFRSF